jgi:lipid-binding SYLF domain-containing protein
MTNPNTAQSNTVKILQVLSPRTLLLIIVCAVSLMPDTSRAASAAEIDAASRAALRQLYASNATARAVGTHARAVLVFPKITKGGFLVAAHHGEGALFMHHGTIGYYNTVAASYGFQAGIQTFGYALFFINDRAMTHLHGRGGWELGSAPSLVIVDQGISKSLSTTNLNKEIYAFFFNQKGLMGGLGLQGSKITEIHPR